MQLAHSSLAPSSWPLYHSAWRKFHSTLASMGVSSALPVTDAHLEFFVSAVADSLSLQTIKTYVSAIKYFNTLAGFSYRSIDGDRLRLILRGLRREKSQNIPRPPRIPITTDSLHTLLTFVSTHFDQHDALIFRAAFLMAFFFSASCECPSSRAPHPIYSTQIPTCQCRTCL